MRLIHCLQALFLTIHPPIHYFHQQFLTTWLWLVLLLCLLAIHNHKLVGIDMAAENGEFLNGEHHDDVQYLFIIRHGDRWDYSDEDVCYVQERMCDLSRLLY